MKIRELMEYDNQQSISDKIRSRLKEKFGLTDEQAIESLNDYNKRTMEGKTQTYHLLKYAEELLNKQNEK